MKIYFCCLMASMLLFTACKLDDLPDVGYDFAAAKDVGGALDKGTNCDGASSLAAPMPGPTPPSSYAYKIMPIRGSAPGASLVGAETTAGQAKLANVGSSGTFCIEVDLVKGTNNIKLYGVSSGGCQGKLSQAYPVSYSGSDPSPDMGVVQPANLAKGKSITADSSPSSGSVTNVNDGSTTTSATFSFSDIEYPETCNKCAWVKVDLGKAYTVSKFRIRWASDANTDYARWYSILTAKSTPAQNPDCTVNAGWIMTHSETDGQAVPKDIIVQPVAARYVVFQMCENKGTGTSETFKLAEFEVWGVDPGATTPPNPDRCK